jgi:hypothetical protein
MPANRPDLLDTVLASVHPTDTCIFVWLAEIIFDIIATMHVGQELRTNHPGGSSNDKTFKISRFVSRIGVVETRMPANRPDLLDTVLASIHPTETCIFIWLAKLLFDIIAT